MEVQGGSGGGLELTGSPGRWPLSGDGQRQSCRSGNGQCKAVAVWAEAAERASAYLSVHGAGLPVQHNS